MLVEATPNLGLTQPALGRYVVLPYCVMDTRQSKKDRKPSLLRGVLARNVLALRDRRFKTHRTVTARNVALAAAAHTTLSQIQRILDEEVGCGLEMLDSLAQALKVRPQDLITPYHTVEPMERPARNEQPARIAAE